MTTNRLEVEEAFLQLTSILSDHLHCGLFTCILTAYMGVHKYMLCKILQFTFQKDFMYPCIT